MTKKSCPCGHRKEGVVGSQNTTCQETSRPGLQGADVTGVVLGLKKKLRFPPRDPCTGLSVYPLATRPAIRPLIHLVTDLNKARC